MDFTFHFRELTCWVAWIHLDKWSCFASWLFSEVNFDSKLKRITNKDQKLKCMCGIQEVNIKESEKQVTHKNTFRFVLFVICSFTTDSFLKCIQHYIYCFLQIKVNNQLKLEYFNKWEAFILNSFLWFEILNVI